MLNTAAAEKAEDSSTMPGDTKMFGKKKTHTHLLSDEDVNVGVTRWTFYSKN